MTILSTKAFPFLLLAASYADAFQMGNGRVRIGSGITTTTTTTTTRTIPGTGTSSPTPTTSTAFSLGNLNSRMYDNLRRSLLSSSRLSTTDLHYIQRDADYGEILAGGQRYEMVELPDSMLDTTIFVGNLCEFVTDDMLSTLFQEVSTLNFVPACVARKPNMSSLKYGFVTFPTVSEKEAAIIKFTGYELNNKKMKVEEIQDFDKVKRVRVPEKLVVYAVGEVKRTREGQKNTMRRVTNSREGGGPSGGNGTGRSSGGSNNGKNLRYSNRSKSRSRNGSSRSLSSSSSSSSGLASLLSPRSSMSSSYSKDRKRSNRRGKKRSQSSSSSSSMLGSDVVRRDGYKNMKRREKRKNRRMKNNNMDDFGLI